MYNTSFIKKILLAATVVFLYSCDKDFNAIGDDLIGDDHFGLESEKYDVIAYNQEVTPIQSNSLVTNALGIYDNPVFGTTTANYNTQVGLAAYAPSVGDAPVVDSVVVSIPYFSHIKDTKTNGSIVTNTYELDSIYGGLSDATLKLSVYESKYQMRSSYFDNGTQFAQLYYNDQNSDFDANKGTVRLNDDQDKRQNDTFFFSSLEIKEKTKDKDNKDVTTSSAPAMRLKLNNAFFQTKILNAPKEKLSAADVFQEYFRGLYFKVERTDKSSNMALMDFSKGKITVYYKAKTDITTDPDDTKENRTIVINLTGSNVNLLQDVKDAAYQDAVGARNVTTGDRNLYLKGGQGSLAIIELKDFASKLEEIRTNKWLVNEANLVFYIDAAKMAKKAGSEQAQEPKRVYLYDLTNNTPLLDYSIDGSSSITSDPRMSKVIFGGIINVDATTKRGTFYKIRVTNHIRNLIKTTTAANVKLGLVVTDDISIITSNKLKNRIQMANPNEYFSEAPRASVMNPLGTILFGNNIPAGDSDYDKRLRLEVYYTKPNK